MEHLHKVYIHGCAHVSDGYIFQVNERDTVKRFLAQLVGGAPDEYLKLSLQEVLDFWLSEKKTDCAIENKIRITLSPIRKTISEFRRQEMSDLKQRIADLEAELKILQRDADCVKVENVA